MTDPNGVSNRYVYDRNGRIRAVFGPNDGDIDQGSLYPSILYSYSSFNSKFLKMNIMSRNEYFVKSKGSLPYKAEFKDEWKQCKQTSINTAMHFDGNYLQAGDYPYPNDLPYTVSNEALFFDGFGRPLEIITEYDTDSDIVIISNISKLDGLGREKETYRSSFLSDPVTKFYQLYGVHNRNLSLETPYQSPTFQQPKITREFDALGRVIKVTAPGGALATYEYDQWKVTEIDPNGHKKSYYSDAYGRLIKVDEFYGKYGVQGEQVSTTAKTDIEMKSSGIMATGLKELAVKNGTLISMADNSELLKPFLPQLPYVTSYEYDITGNLVRITDSKGNEVFSEYDALGRRIYMTSPDSGGFAGKKWQYKYDPADNVTEIIDAKGQHIGIKYDEINRLVEKSYYTVTEQVLDPDDPRLKSGVTISLKKEAQSPVHFIYDDTKIGGPFATGRLVKMTDSSGAEIYSYDNEGNVKTLEKIIDGTSYQMEFDYDAVGRIKSLMYPDKEQVLYIYAKDGNLSAVKSKSNGTYLENALFDAVGNLRRLTYGNGIETRFDYDEKVNGNQFLNRIAAGIFSKKKSSETQAVTSSGKSSSSQPIATLKDQLNTQVDKLNLLTHSADNLQMVSLVQELGYSYDLKGNIGGRKDNKYPEHSAVYGYDSFDRLVSNSVNGKINKFQFDSLGNMTLI